MRRRVKLPPLCREKYEHIYMAVVSHQAAIHLVISCRPGFDPRGFSVRLDQSPACLNVLSFKSPLRTADGFRRRVALR